MSQTELSNTMYDLLHAMGKDAGFLYETIDTYIKDAQNANKSDLERSGKQSRRID
jgi:hypothetical protein